MVYIHHGGVSEGGQHVGAVHVGANLDARTPHRDHITTDHEVVLERKVTQEGAGREVVGRSWGWGGGRGDGEEGGGDRKSHVAQ